MNEPSVTHPKEPASGERLYHTSLLPILSTLLVSYSSTLLALAEGGPAVAYGTIPLAFATLLFVDLQPMLRIPAFVTNVLGVLAFSAAFIDFMQDRIDARLLAGGHLLVYLTWVFLIQQKDVRHYWWLSALAVLQVSVASVLTMDFWFGPSLILFAFLATWMMSVFLVDRSLGTASGDREHRSVHSAVASEERIPVAEVRSGFSHDLSERFIGWRFITSTLVIVCASLLLSVVFFLLVPRVWIGNFQLFGNSVLAAANRPLTGFTDRVRLGDLGEILESSEPVLDIKVTNRETQDVLDELEVARVLGATPLFRGAVMERYEAGQWVRDDSTHAMSFRNWDNSVGEYRLEMRLQPIGSRTLFSVADVATVRPDEVEEAIIVEQFSGEFQRPHRADLTGPYSYIMDVNPGKGPRSPASLGPIFGGRRYEYLLYLRRMIQMPPNLDRLVRWVEELEIDARNEADFADQVVRLLRDSGEYTYSMNLSISDASVDPVEDFLFNRKQGHCEYYASALALILRSVGIPTRVISGFKGGAYDQRRQVFAVRQLHAHAWVEAFIDGQWRTYDPTPASRDESVSELQNNISSWQLLQGKIRSFWNFSARMSQTQQQQYVYKPIQERAVSTWKSIKEFGEKRGAFLQELRELIRNPRRWISWQGGAVAFVLLCLLSAIIYSVRFAIRMYQRWQQQLGQRQHRQHIEF